MPSAAKQLIDAVVRAEEVLASLDQAKRELSEVQKQTDTLKSNAQKEADLYLANAKASTEGYERKLKEKETGLIRWEQELKKREEATSWVAEKTRQLDLREDDLNRLQRALETEIASCSSEKDRVALRQRELETTAAALEENRKSLLALEERLNQTVQGGINA